jgi:mannose-6-phosphate isomerase
MTTPFQPCVLTFTPIYKPYVWGGRRLPEWLGRASAPALERYAESWELSDLPDGMSTVAAGPYAGQSLHALMRDHARALTGRDIPSFPLLVKILDAADRLSVQVHPDNDSARRHGGEAKTECWYILDAEPGASVWAGLRDGVTADSFRNALATGAVPDLLQRIPVQRGDLLFIPGGRVHAIGAGCLILEVQQSSNTTYRVFDWNRKGIGEKHRELHVEQAMRTIRWDDSAPALAPPGPPLAQGANRIRERVACPYFKVEELTLREPLDVCHCGDTFHALFTGSTGLRVRGDGFDTDLPAGITALIPAAVRNYVLIPRQAEAAVIRISAP